VTDECDNAAPTAEESPMSAEVATSGERAPWLAPYRWTPGQSGNPSGRPRESGSLAAALRRVGVKPAKTRAELTKLAVQLGMDPDEARNIDVVAGLIYDGITQLLIRTVKGSTGAGDKLVGLLQLLFKALDGDERRITLSGPDQLQAALTSILTVNRSAARSIPTSSNTYITRNTTSPNCLGSLEPTADTPNFGLDPAAIGYHTVFTGSGAVSGPR
jgi:hypothetical protein